MALLVQHLRSQVSVGPAKAVSALQVSLHVLPAEAKVSKHGVALGVEDDVVGLEVPEDYVALVKSLD